MKNNHYLVAVPLDALEKLLPDGLIIEGATTALNQRVIVLQVRDLKADHQQCASEVNQFSIIGQHHDASNQMSDALEAAYVHLAAKRLVGDQERMMSQAEAFTAEYLKRRNAP